MSILSKLLILIIVIICLYVVYILFQDRIALYEMKNSGGSNFTPFKNSINEGFTNSIVTSIQSKNPIQSVKINNYAFQNLIPQFGITNPLSTQLNQFCIKSSCNAAYNGEEVSLDMLQYVLSRGCRFLDFEIYWGTPTLPDNVQDKSHTTEMPVVSVSDDPTTPGTNAISLYSVFNYIKQNAFNNSFSPNSQDPLFIQLRVKYLVSLNQTNNQNALYDSIAQIIGDRFGRLKYSGNVDGTTNITLLAGQIVIIMDTYANRDYVGVSPMLANSINMESNSNNMTHTTYEDVITQKANSFPINGNGIVTNMTVIEQVLPMSTVNSIQYLFTENYDAMSVISKYSAQFTPMLFWSNDSYLQAYEKMFNSIGTGITILSSAMNHADGQQIVPAIVYP